MDRVGYERARTRTHAAGVEQRACHLEVWYDYFI